MKQFLTTAIFATLCFPLISWASTGAVAQTFQQRSAADKQAM